ncbi:MULTISPECIES: hypothetical protein [Pedobacter]|uniref:hypothetical protein n=1 Tax=Pedobacter TaxID=84567 RepID=UPI00210DD96D|nr:MULTISPECIES: hypothetical protein [unclassified Pedobacter]
MQEETKKHPAPSDEVQKDIETVTPDTEKEGLPNDRTGEVDESAVTKEGREEEE